MTFFPQLTLGILNGWLLFGLYVATFGTLMAVFPKDVVKRLYDRSEWSHRQKRGMRLGKLFSLACIAFIVMTPLKVGQPIFTFGVITFVVGLLGLVIALFNYKNTPVNQPARTGLYTISRNPQIVALFLIFAGMCLVIGSWIAFLMLFIGQLFQLIFLIKAEEAACLAQYGDDYSDYMDRVPRYLLIF